MKQYLDYLQDIMDNGFDHEDRTGVGRRSVFHRTMRFDLTEGFPLVTTKKVFTKGFIEELLWFLSGSSNIKTLNEKGVHIWDDWAITEKETNIPKLVGSIGPLYGPVLRGMTHNQTIDQISDLIESLKSHPFHSRHLATTFIPCLKSHHDLSPRRNVMVGRGALYPCHGIVIQCFVSPPKENSNKNRLSLTMYQRSVDSFLGLPFNIGQYALLTMMIAQCVDMEPYEFIWTGGDCHIYLNHFDQIKEQLSRTPYESPTMLLNKEIKDIFSFTSNDFSLVNYKSHEAIKAPIAV